MSTTAPVPAIRRAPEIALPAYALGLAVLGELGIALFCLQVVFTPLMIVTVGVPALLGIIPAVRWYANLHRSWARSFVGVDIPVPYRKPPVPGAVNYLRTALTDPATWRDLAWLIVNATAGFVMNVVAASLFLYSIFFLIWPFLWWITGSGDGAFNKLFGFIHLSNLLESFITWPLAVLSYFLWSRFGRRLIRANALLTRKLLGPAESALLTTRVRELSETRAETIDTQAAELRRIERDLHDGAQARLAALSMNLGMAEEMVERDPASAQQLLTEARQSAGQALSELRDLVRGIHPPVLADRGLGDAVRALAMAVPLKVDVRIDLPGRPPAAAESAAYFAVAEALANLTKHSAATTAWIQVSYGDRKLHLLIGDDGIGGATVTPGGGLHGIERRLAAFDGTLAVSSPTGGPTTVVMELPCELS